MIKSLTHYCKDSQITSLKLFLIVTHFVNFKHNFPKEMETFFKNKLIRFKEKIVVVVVVFIASLPFGKHIHIYYSTLTDYITSYP